MYSEQQTIIESVQKLLFDLGHAKVTPIYSKDGSLYAFGYIDRSPGRISCKKIKTYQQCLTLLKENIEAKLKPTVTFSSEGILNINTKTIKDFDGRAVEVECGIASYLLKRDV